MSRVPARAWAGLALAAWLGLGAPAQAQLSVGIDLPGLSIGINVPVYPQLVRVPGYPVYWAPQGQGNYFFLDGLYWVYRNDDWYRSSWYNGPWRRIGPDEVPVYLLRVPVRYYRQPPAYFRPWRADAPPRWGEHWGPDWQQRRPGWDRWDRRSAPAPAPLPVYQREYRGDRYPQAPQQQDDIRRDRERSRDGDRAQPQPRPAERPTPARGNAQERPQGRSPDRPGQSRGREEKGEKGEKGEEESRRGQGQGPERGKGNGNGNGKDEHRR